MSSKTFIAGPFSSIYIGTGAGSEVLVPLISTRTGGIRGKYEVPEVFLPVKGRSEQTDSAKLQAECTFIGLDDNILKLANNNPLSQTNADDPSTQATYTVLFVHPNPKAKSLLLVGGAWTDITIDSAFTKSGMTTCPVVFRNENPNRFVQLYYLRQLPALKTILGARYPLM